MRDHLVAENCCHSFERATCIFLLHVLWNLNWPRLPLSLVTTTGEGMMTASTSFLVPSPLPNLTINDSAIPSQFCIKQKNGIRLKANPCIIPKQFARRKVFCLNNLQPVTFEKDTEPLVETGTWNWKGYSIRYQSSGEKGPALVLIHGFGANSDHWRNNISVLAKSHRVYSIDLIGYGYSDKPNPVDFGDESFYTFETWGTQLNDFCSDVVKDKAFFICNSIGGLVGLQAAVTAPHLCEGMVLLNISLRMLHIQKQPWLGRPFIKFFQNLLRKTAVGEMFFRSVATSNSIKNILCQCYYDTSKVTDELVEKILLPGLQPGASDVFLEFICYSNGPLPEDLLPMVTCPVLIGWGDKDPWEPIELGRAYADFNCVEDFVVLPNVGHCPQDEAPNLVNPLVESFVSRHSKR